MCRHHKFCNGQNTTNTKKRPTGEKKKKGASGRKKRKKEKEEEEEETEEEEEPRGACVHAHGRLLTKGGGRIVSCRTPECPPSNLKADKTGQRKDVSGRHEEAPGTWADATRRKRGAGWLMGLRAQGPAARRARAVIRRSWPPGREPDLQMNTHLDLRCE